MLPEHFLSNLLGNKSAQKNMIKIKATTFEKKFSTRLKLVSSLKKDLYKSPDEL